jgi:hypothetical protein
MKDINKKVQKYETFQYATGNESWTAKQVLARTIWGPVGHNLLLLHMIPSLF